MFINIKISVEPITEFVVFVAYSIVIVIKSLNYLSHRKIGFKHFMQIFIISKSDCNCSN